MRDVALTPADATVIALVTSALAIAIAGAPQSAMRVLDGEFGIVETVSALAYPIGACCAFLLAWHTRGLARAHWILWTVLCVLFFGEETSWLQHWTGYATPAAVKKINVQGEFNLHNLVLLSSPDALFGAHGHFTWKMLVSAQSLFYAGFTTYFLLVPLAMAIAPVRALGQRLGVPRLSPTFVAAVWGPIAVTVVLTLLYAADEDRKSLIAETREMLMALAIAWFIAMAWLRRAR